MEGSVAAAPAAGDAAAQQGQPGPAEQGGQPTPEQQFAPPGGEQQQQQETPDDPVLAQLQTMEQQLKSVQDQFAQAQGPQPTDLVSALLGDEGEGLTPEEVAAFQQQQQPGQQEQGQQGEQPDLSELDKFVKERIEQAVNPIVEQRQDEQLRTFQEKNPDIMQPGVFDKVKATLENLVERYGDGVMTDLSMVEMAYRGVKAQEADASAVPAGQAGDHGASLETQAGQSQAGETSVEDNYKAAVFDETASGGEGFR